MRAKLYITGIPFYFTEMRLRVLLGDYHLHSLTFVHTVHGDVGVVELNSLEDAQMLTASLSRFTLEGDCKLSVVPTESREGHAIERLLSRMKGTSDKDPPKTFRRSA